MKLLPRIYPITLVFAMLLSGCAAHKSHQLSAPPAVQESEVHYKQLLQLHQELSTLLSVGGAAECETACSLSHNICGLALKICDISKKHPDDSRLIQKCRDAHDRCARAKNRVEPLCGCSFPAPLPTRPE